MVCRSYPIQWHSIGLLLLLLLLLWLLFVSVFKPFILPNILVHIYLHLPPFMTASDTWHIISTYQMHGQCISWIIVASPGRSPVLLKQMLGAIIWYTTAVVYIWCSCSKVINTIPGTLGRSENDISKHNDLGWVQGVPILILQSCRWLWGLWRFIGYQLDYRPSQLADLAGSLIGSL